MLHGFLELNTKNKLKLISALYTYNTMSQKMLCDVLDISFRGISSLIESINEDINGIGTIQKTDKGLSLIRYKDVNFFYLFRSISKHSTTLDSLRFLLMNDQHKSFMDFASKIYLTRSSAYRTRKRCVEFLESIGLEVVDNYVVGQEYRIRFLMALLHYKYGVDCYEMDSKSLDLIRNFVLSTNQKIDLNYLKCSEMEYGFFEYLVMLTWKRITFGKEEFQSWQIDKFKEIFVYKDMCDALQKHVGIQLDISFESKDFDYLYVVYCCTNNCLFADKWTKGDVSMVYEIIRSDPKYENLVHMVGDLFPKEMRESKVFRTMLIYFYKKCFLGLQCIIPDKNFFTNQEKDVFTNCIFRPLKEVIDFWLMNNGNHFPIDDDHVLYLSIQMEHVLKQYINPVDVYILSDLSVELDIMRAYLKRRFSSERIHITSVYLNAQSKESLHNLENAIVIVNRKFVPVVHCLALEQKNVIVVVSAELTKKEETMIEDKIIGYENKEFMNLIECYTKR